MKNIIAIFFFLPLAITDHQEHHPPDLRYDITNPSLSSIFEKLRQLSSSAITNFFREWIFHHQPFVIDSKIMDSKNISFSKFISDEEIIWFLNIKSINCRTHLPRPTVTFRTIANKRRNVSVEGNIEFFHKNNTSACQLSFNIKLDRLGIDLSVNGEDTVDQKNIRINFTPRNYVELSNSNKKSCKNAYEDGLRSIHDNILQIIEQRLAERLVFMTESVVEYIYSNCPHINKKFHDKRENYYVYFKQNRNMDEFPWMYDYEELMIRGLSDVYGLRIHFNIYGSDFFEINVKNVKIYWNITSTSSKPEQFDGTLHEILWYGTINNDLSINTSTFGVNSLSLQQDGQCIEVAPDTLNYIKHIIEAGIKQTYRSLPRNYSDVKVTSTISKILRPFENKSFETLFLDLEKTTSSSFPETIHFSTILLKGFNHVETISCSLSEYSKIGTIHYEQIIAQAEFSRKINEKYINQITISGKVYIKNATVCISLNRTSNLTKRFEVTVDDTFNNSNNMVAIESGNYHLSKKDRTEIGKRIFDKFIDTIKNQVIETTNSMLSPILEVCENSPGNTTEFRSNRYNVQKQFFALINDLWYNERKAVDVIINGWWNYKSINMQYFDKTIIVDGIRIENVTVNIKQFDERKEIGYSDDFFIIEHILLTIQHTAKRVQVNIPKFSATCTNASIAPKTEEFDRNESNAKKNLELTIASFIEQSIYIDDQNYYKKFQNLVAKEMRNASREYTSHYDVTSQFTWNFVKKLVLITEHSHNTFIEMDLEEEIQNHCLTNETKWVIDPLNLTIVPFYEFNFSLSTEKRPMVLFEDKFFSEEICDYSNHSMVQLNVKDIPMLIQGGAKIMRNSKASNGTISYRIYIIKTKFSYNRFDDTLQMEFDDKNIQLQLSLEENEIMRNLEEVDQDVIKKKMIEITRSSLSNMTLSIRARLSTFCRIPRNENNNPNFSPTLIERYFYSINGTIEYTSRRFLMYYIQIYGLLNFKTVSILSNAIFKEFEFKLVNLTARILWNYYMGGLIPKIPVLKVIDLRIDEISLVGKFGRRKNVLNFLGTSQIKFSDQENSLPTEMLKYTFEPIVLQSIQKSITTEFDKTRGKTETCNI